MKNLLHNIQIWIMLVLTMASVQSCADDTPEMNQAEVSFTATLPADVRSRSFGDAEQVNTLVVGVFDEQKVEIYRQTFTITGATVDFQLTLAQSQTYHFVFWAYDSRQTIYDLTHLDAIRMKVPTTSVTFEQVEASDAFFATKKNVRVVGNMEYNIELVRPLAQINVGTIGKVMQASFKAKSIPDIFHPFDNTVQGSTDFIWSYNETTTETFSVNGQRYNYLAMGYVFAPTTAISIVTELTLTDANAQTTETVEFTEVEIEANHRSNIVGQFTAE